MSEGPSKKLAAGTSVVRAACKVIITATDECEASLIEDSLKDPELMSLVILTGAIRRLPRERGRLQAEKLIEALKQIGEPLPEGIS